MVALACLLGSAATVDFASHRSGIEALGAADAGVAHVGPGAAGTDAAPHDPSFATDHFSGSANCEMCHDGLTDRGGADVSLVAAWRASTMAQSSVDPLWRAKVASEVRRTPDLAAEIEAKCSRCHAPMANAETAFAGTAPSLSPPGFLDAGHALYDAALDGVSCTLCHQIEDAPDLGTDPGFSGGFSIADRLGVERALYGPYADPRTRPMQMHVAYTPMYGHHVEQSELCATCHNLDTPVVDAGGRLTDDHFAEQAVYTEWLHSDFADTRSCQSCHMPQADGPVVISTHGGNLAARAPFFRHGFEGGNTYLLELLARNREDLGVIAEADALGAHAARTREQLMAAARVEVRAPRFEADRLRFDVLVRNLSGHKLPTSFPSRRVWLHVTVSDGTGAVTFESGAVSPDGRIVGVDDRRVGDAYEPHRTTISDPSRAAVYETVMGDSDGHPTFTLMRAARFLKDNRILPTGFSADAPASVRPQGLAAADPDFRGGADTVVYEIAGLGGDTYVVSAVLRYQALSYPFAQDLYADEGLDAVARFRRLDAGASVRTEVIASATVRVERGAAGTPSPAATDTPATAGPGTETPTPTGPVTSVPTAAWQSGAAWLPRAAR